MCRCVERRQVIKQAARGQVSVSQATSYVAKTLTEDGVAKVQRALDRRLKRRVA